jgi:hypothetical protein
MPLGFDEPFGIATKALRCALRVAPGEHIRISTRKRHGIEGRKSGSRPLLMSLLLGLVQAIDERCKNLHEEMVATKAVASCATREAAPLNSWVKTAQPGETAVSIASMKTSMLLLSSAGSQHVSIKLLCPLTTYASSAASEAHSGWRPRSYRAPFQA